ncbi:MAG: hypothetical protein K6F73_10105 [Lachnospiraceae bacterium]|nr:hypothetical protein [Lachnospiraceae bacterium]
MISKETSGRFIIICSAVSAMIVRALLYVPGRSLFSFPDRMDDRYKLALFDYGICAVLSCLVLFAIFNSIFTVLFAKGKKRDAIAGVLRCALFYLPAVIAVIAIKLPAGYLTNDEYSIFRDATGLVHDTWFNYMTVYYYIISLMILPFKYGPIVIKALVQVLTAGYCIYRARGYFGKKAGWFMYVLFLLYPVIAYTTSAHRLPLYFLIYLIVFTKLAFDILEKRGITPGAEAALLIAGAVLTQWRTEGIYLLVLLPILMFIAYPQLRNKRSALILIISYLAVQYILSVPQNGMGTGIGGAANDRMKPFYAYTVTNMYRNGLDMQKNAADLEIIDRYLSLDMIEKINEHYGDINYEDVLILYKEEFNGVRPEAGYTEYYEFTQAAKRLFVNNPDVFAKTRWGAFCYAALPYHMTFPWQGAGIARSAISIVKSLSYNLFIPVAIAFVLALASLIGRNWYTFFVSGGLAAHWFIVFVLAPASYFKYYFPVYILSYFYVTVLLIWFFSARKTLVCPVKI